jgi:hypothetical protein
MGSALSTFNDFMDNTGPSFLTGATDIVNEAVKNNYLLRRFMRGKGPSETIQGGSTIRDSIMLDEKSTFQYYQPNETFAWQNPQTLDQWDLDWRFSVDHMSWTDHEIELNTGGQGRNARHSTYKEIKRSKEQRLWTSLFNGMEDALFRVPNYSEMEDSTGTRPYSLPAFINDQGSTLADAAGTGKIGTWATDKLQDIEPSKLKWQNRVATYSNTTQGLLSSFDELFMALQFQPPPSHQEYFENPTMNARFIACSRLGLKAYIHALRSNQDTFVTASRQDPSYMKPQYAGHDLEYVAELDTIGVYGKQTGDASVAAGTSTESAGSSAHKGPRYYFIDGNYLKFVFHTTRYFYTHPTMKHPNQPFTTVMPVDCWHNFICRSRRRQGLLVPSVDYTQTT